jgi:hypothetical protein
MAHGFENLDREPFRRPTAGIDAGELAGFGLPIDRKEVAADSAALRFHHAQRGIRRNRRVNAEPPRASTCAPACDARVWLVATMPPPESTMLRACERSCAGAVFAGPASGPEEIS